jgi:formylglycine-generating enzyme required for sulfatase activity
METKVWNELFGVFAEAHPESVPKSLWTKGTEAGAKGWLGVEGEASRYPVFNVRLAEAVRFATWLGGKLPSDAEWDKAAGLRDHPSDAIGPFTVSGGIEDVAVGRENEGPIPTGSSKDDVSMYGVKDMAGNGWEFTRSPAITVDLPPVEEFENDLSLPIKQRGRSYTEDGPLTFEAMLQPPIGQIFAHKWTSFRVVFEQPEEE